MVRRVGPTTGRVTLPPDAECVALWYPRCETLYGRVSAGVLGVPYALGWRNTTRPLQTCQDINRRRTSNNDDTGRSLEPRANLFKNASRFLFWWGQWRLTHLEICAESDARLWRQAVRALLH